MKVTITVTSDSGAEAFKEEMDGFSEAELTEPGEGTVSLFGVIRGLAKRILEQGGHT